MIGMKKNIGVIMTSHLRSKYFQTRNLREYEEESTLKTETIKQTIPFGDHSGAILEPRITNQRFINAAVLSKKPIEVVKNGRIKLVQKHWKNFYIKWLENIRPWCISRQIWWGHIILA